MNTVLAERVVLSVPELAQVLNWSESTAWRHLASGKLPIPRIKVGGKTFVRTRDVVEFLDKAA